MVFVVTFDRGRNRVIAVSKGRLRRFKTKKKAELFAKKIKGNPRVRKI